MLKSLGITVALTAIGWIGMVKFRTQIGAYGIIKVTHKVWILLACKMCTNKQNV